MSQLPPPPPVPISFRDAPTAPGRLPAHEVLAGDPALKLPADEMADVEHDPLPALYVYLGAGENQGPRASMEDRTCVVKAFTLLSFDGPHDDGVDRTLAAAFDGHGTHVAADVAAQRLPPILAQESGLAGSDGNPFKPDANMYDECKGVWKAMQSGFLKLEEEVSRALSAAGASGGSTAVVVLRIGQILYVANAGDSRAVLCRAGRALRLSHDHVPTEPEEERRIEMHGGRVDEDKGEHGCADARRRVCGPGDRRRGGCDG